MRIEKNLEKLDYSWYFFLVVSGIGCSFSCVITSNISCRIPFSRFLLHFHYCNLLFLWCIVVHSLLTLSFLSWMETAANHLSFFFLARDTLTPEHHSELSRFLNGLRIDLLYIASLQRKLDVACGFCIVIKCNTFYKFFFSFLACTCGGMDPKFSNIFSYLIEDQHGEKYPLPSQL